MTQTPLPYLFSRAEMAVHLLCERAGQWIPAEDFIVSCGRYAWRTRISDARKRLADRGAVENRLRRREDGSTISEYRFVPRTRMTSAHKEA